MSLESQMCVLVRCDSCTELLQGFEEGFTVHFDDESHAITELKHYDWLSEGAKDYCTSCLEAMQEFLGTGPFASVLNETHDA